MKKSTAPVLVYQMGKVASTTITLSLSLWGIENIHVHYLSPAKVSQLVNIIKQRGEALPKNLKSSLSVLNSHLLDADIRIISLVRDPVARNISAFFEHIDFYFKGQDLAEVDENYAINLFFDKYSHEISHTWFENEFNVATKLDIFSYPINNSDTYFEFSINNYEILILKVEADDTTKISALKQFLEIDSEKVIVKSNQAAKRKYSELYQRFLNAIEFDKKYLDTMYDCKQTRFFYSPSEIEQMRNRWKLKK